MHFCLFSSTPPTSFQSFLIGCKVLLPCLAWFLLDLVKKSFEDPCKKPALENLLLRLLRCLRRHLLLHFHNWMFIPTIFRASLAISRVEFFISRNTNWMHGFPVSHEVASALKYIIKQITFKMLRSLYLILFCFMNILATITKIAIRIIPAVFVGWMNGFPVIH